MAAAAYVFNLRIDIIGYKRQAIRTFTSGEANAFHVRVLLGRGDHYMVLLPQNDTDTLARHCAHRFQLVNNSRL